MTKRLIPAARGAARVHAQGCPSPACMGVDLHLHSTYSDGLFTPDELCRRLDISPDGPQETWAGPTEQDSAGRVASVALGGQAFSGAAVRAALGLRSTAFTVRYEDGAFHFTCAGYGHGVGMSQYGAMLLAADGWSYDAILAHYYPGTVIERRQAPSAPL